MKISAFVCCALFSEREESGNIYIHNKVYNADSRDWWNEILINVNGHLRMRKDESEDESNK